MSRIEIECIRVGLIQTNCYLVRVEQDPERPFLAIIDPGEDADIIEAHLKWEPTHIILTHSHFDHVGALACIHERHPSAIIAAGSEEDFDARSIEAVARSAMGYYASTTSLAKNGYKVPAPDLLLNDNDILGPFRVLHTPGHTGGSICLFSEEHKVLFSGDTLFRHSYGRTDLGGSEEQMFSSLRRLLSLPADTTVYPGHDEPTIIADEKRYFGF